MLAVTLARARSAAKPRPSSAIPGAWIRPPSTLGVTSVPAGKTVSRWAERMKGSPPPSPIGAFLPTLIPFSQDVSHLIRADPPGARTRGRVRPPAAPLASS